MNTATAAANDARNIILLYESEVIFNRFRQVFSDHYRIHWGKDLNTTMDILARCDVGVIICDIHFQRQDIYPVVLALKHMHPDLVTMIVSQSQDSAAVLELQGHEEIFAALVRPVSLAKLKETLHAAFEYYLSHRKAEAEQIRAAQQQADAAAIAAGSAFAGMSLIEALAAKAQMDQSAPAEDTAAAAEAAPEPAAMSLPEDIRALDMIDASSIAPAQDSAAAPEPQHAGLDENSMDFMFFEDIEFDE